MHVERNIVDRSEVTVLFRDVVHHNGIAAGRRIAGGAGLRLWTEPAHRAPFVSCCGSRTSAVMPGTSAPSGLSTFSLRPMVLMAGLGGVAPRGVAKPL